MNPLAVIIPDPGLPVLPEVVAAAGDRAGMRFVKFFTAIIRNPHTRRAYGCTVAEFLALVCQHQRRSIAAMAARSRRHLD